MPTKRARQFAPKVKTGCQTCRIRRVKCDEQQPNCRKCSTTGRKCDGYDRLPVPSGKHIIQMHDDIEERRLFYHFRTVTSVQFSTDSVSTFWSGILLQACHVSTSLRYAAIALASLHEKFVGLQPTQNGVLYAFKNYTKALTLAREYLLQKDQFILITLMCSVLFYCFESLCGHLASAIIHLRSGLNIFHARKLQESTSSSTQSVLKVFIRLGFQANYFVDKTHPIHQAGVVGQLRSLKLNNAKEPFSLDEMKTTLYACFNDTMFSDHITGLVSDLDISSNNYHKTKCAQFILFGSTSPSFIKGRERAVIALEKWRVSFEAYIRARDVVNTNQDDRAIMLLRLHHLVASLMLSTSHDDKLGKPKSRAKIDDFKTCVEWAKALLENERARVNIPVLSPDVGVIPPLFFVATKCPSSRLRAAAKDLLALGPRREGLWDASRAVKIIEELNLEVR